MSGAHDNTSIADGSETSGRRPLSVEVIAEHRESKIVKPAGVVSDVPTDHEPVADADRLMAGGVAGGGERLNRPVSQEVMLSVNEDHLLFDARVVLRLQKVAFDRLAVLPGGPFPVLHIDWQVGGKQTESRLRDRSAGAS